MIRVGIDVPLLCAVVYHLPQASDNFRKDFSGFLSLTVPKWDRILILKDFIIHICCPDRHLVLNKAFNLPESIYGLKHKCGHKVDLVLSDGSDISNFTYCNACISDHVPFVFNGIILDSVYRFQDNNSCFYFFSPGLLQFTSTYFGVNQTALSHCSCICVNKI